MMQILLQMQAKMENLEEQNAEIKSQNAEIKSELKSLKTTTAISARRGSARGTPVP